MKITFINPSMFGERVPSSLEPLTFAVLKSLTPEEYHVEFYDENIEDIPLDLDTDLIAISVQTFTARRAYILADEYRKKGIPVVMGGFHPSIMPDEVLEHCDSMVIGAAEGCWEALLDDLSKGKLKKKYKSQQKEMFITSGDRSIYHNKKYPPLATVEFGRGCKYDCDFCVVCRVNKGYSHKDIDVFVDEVKRIDKKHLFIIDDNIYSNPSIAKELFKAMIPLKKKWLAQISIDVVNDDEALDLMIESGCFMVMIGFESLDEGNLEQIQKKSRNTIQDYQSAIEKIHRKGLMIYGAFVHGYDNDDPDLIEKSVDFAINNHLAICNFNLLLPYPSTPLYQRLISDSKMLYPKWWIDSEYKYGTPAFVPKKMSGLSLLSSCWTARKDFYSYQNILRRYVFSKYLFKEPVIWSMNLIAGLASRKEIYQKQGRLLGGDDL